MEDYTEDFGDDYEPELFEPYHDFDPELIVESSKVSSQSVEELSSAPMSLTVAPVEPESFLPKRHPTEKYIVIFKMHI